MENKNNTCIWKPMVWTKLKQQENKEINQTKCRTMAANERKQLMEKIEPIKNGKTTRKHKWVFLEDE